MLTRFFHALSFWPPKPSSSGKTFSEALYLQAEAHLPFLAFLEPTEQLRLRQCAYQFLAQKQFYGANGFHLDNLILLIIALQACLPVLHLGLQHYQGWVGIVIYPGEFVVPRQEMDEFGLVHEFDEPILGEAWENGPVLLSWQEEQSMAADGINIVIHEFAHKLDMSKGSANGLPPLWPQMSAQTWAQVFRAAFKQFRLWVDQDLDTPLDPYASESPAEFFAVCSEAFFLMPCQLRDAFPLVYEQLRLLYRLDPAKGEQALLMRSSPCSATKPPSGS